jgi:predicted DNA-binding transcriptional regulator AlpA
MKNQTNDSQLTDVTENALMPVESSESRGHSFEDTRRVSSLRAAELLGVSETTLRKWRMGGSGPRFIKMGSRVVYDTGELEDWLERRSRTTTTSSYRAPSRVEKLESAATSLELSACGTGELND